MNVSTCFPYTKASVISDWLSKKGYNGDLEDCFSLYVIDNASIYPYNSPFDKLEAFLADSGYSGTLQDMLTQKFQLFTGIPYRKDAERNFLVILEMIYLHKEKVWKV